MPLLLAFSVHGARVGAAGAPRIAGSAVLARRGISNLVKRRTSHWVGFRSVVNPSSGACCVARRCFAISIRWDNGVFILTVGQSASASSTESGDELRESPYTVPNALTIARLLACPILGYTIVQGDFGWATGILLACGFSDWLDGWIARTWHVQSVLGSILDPAADKALMTTLVGTLAWSGLLPWPLAVLILGRDVALSLSAFYIRFVSLPPPRTLRRYFDPSMPSAEVKPTQISKVNTALQLLLMGVTTASPLLSLPVATPLAFLQWTVAGTTIWSGLSYLSAKGWSNVTAKKG